MDICSYFSSFLREQLKDFILSHELQHIKHEKSNPEKNREDELDGFFSKIFVEQDFVHADLSTNAAQVLSRLLKKNPVDVAHLISQQITHEWIEKIEIKGPGFINLTLRNSFWKDRFFEILKKKENFGKNNIGKGKKANIEFVSVNPTGPLHAGHARNAILGDVISSLLSWVGYDVCREYYINDAGGQIKALGESLYLRYAELLGKKITSSDFTQDMYGGDYLIPIAQFFLEQYGDQYLNTNNFTVFEEFAVQSIMKTIKKDLNALGVTMDVYTSEKKLHQMQAISSAISYLKEHKCVVEDTLQKPKGHTVDTYEERRQLLFKATDYGDDMDRPLQKENGEWTYFAGDIAYHFNKIERGFDTLIDILGADHSGYVKRIKACVSALLKSKNGQNNEIDLDAVKFDVKVCQMVNFVDQGKPVRMSKRSGNFITLSDVLEKVEKDSVRYMMVSRHNDMGIDFDFSIVLDQSKDNPIFYIQYAHARICSVFRHAVLLFPDASTFFVDCGVSGSLPDSLFDLLTEPLELLIIKHLSAWPRRVFVSYQSLEPHRIAHFMYDIAGLFHSLWNKGRENAELRFLDAKNKELTFARLALLFAIKTVIVNGLSILGMEPSQKM